MYATTGLTGSEAEFACLRNTFDTIGFVAIRNDRTQAIAQDLSREARGLTDDLQRAVRDDGELTYSAGIAPLGRQAQGFLTGAELSEVMHALTGARHALSNDMSCLTHYGAGDQLGPHVDQPAERCAVTCILYLTCQSPDASAADTGLQLRIFGQARSSTTSPPRAVIRTVPGCLVLGRGATFWHERPKLKTGESVVALTACFGAVS